MKCISLAAPIVRRSRAVKLSILLLIIVSLFSGAYGQWDSFEKDRTRGMLSNIRKAIEKNYYDPNFHGVNLEEKFKVADEKIKSATSLGQAYGIIGQTLVDLNDSHTFFIPPQRSAK